MNPIDVCNRIVTRGDHTLQTMDFTQTWSVTQFYVEMEVPREISSRGPLLESYLHIIRDIGEKSHLESG